MDTRSDNDGARYRVAADIGGTFTDIAVVGPGGTLLTRKVPSTPEDYGQGVVEGVLALLQQHGLASARVGELLHASTVATNAILEGRGARTALITTEGFRDVLELRRIRVPRLYEPLYEKPRPLIPRRFRFEARERMSATGAVLLPLVEADVVKIATVLKDEGIESVAVTFLHSYANSAHERRVGEILRSCLPGVDVSLSVDVLPEIREYERTSTTVINAYISPPMRAYLRSLRASLQASGISPTIMMMQSSGGVMSLDRVLERPAEIVESGPAAGVIGAAFVASRSGFENVITFDMGGTTAKAALIENGVLLRTDEYEVGGGISLSSRLVKGGGYALKFPVIDISEVGAGGGSLVWIDRGGVLKVGPRSAGAVPGPACYGTGGTQPTVTDANVALGYLNPEALAGGQVPIHAARARESLSREVAAPLGQSLEAAAYGVHCLASSTMMRAVKAVSTYRGRDPRDFTLFAFGGNGGVHAAQLARDLGMERIVVPPAAGVFSAVGLLLADKQMRMSRSLLCALADADIAVLDEAYAALEGRLIAEFAADGNGRPHLERQADLRYRGQAFELNIPVPGEPLTASSLAAIGEAFNREHEKTYGHRHAEESIELVALRVVASVPPSARPYAPPARNGALREARRGHRRAYFGAGYGFMDTPVLDRLALHSEWEQGPLIVEEYEGTTIVPPDARARLDAWSNILIELQPRSAS